MKLKNSLVTIAIALLFVFFIGYGIEVFDATPRYEDYCPKNLYEMQTQETCEQAGGVWQAYEKRESTMPSPGGFCSEPQECRDAFQDVNSDHDKVVFITSLIIGVIGFITGILLKKEIISNGLLGGSVLLLLYGTIRYWQYASNILKFVLLGVALTIVIWLTYKKLEK